MKRAVLLGGSGFIGRWLSRSLIRRGLEVVALDLRQPEEKGVRYIRADLGEPEDVARAVEPGDAVVHLVHSSIPVESMNDPGAELSRNVIPYAELLERVADAGAALIAYSSSGGQVYGEAMELPLQESAPERPVTAYGVAKLAMEHLTRLATRRRGMSHILFRMGNPYGPLQELTNRHGIVPRLVRSVNRGEPVTVYGGGATVRDYVFVEDAAEAVAALVTGDALNTTVNIGTGAGASLNDLVALVEKVSGGKVSREDAPMRDADVERNVLDISLLKRLTGFEPETTLEQGLEATWRHLKQNEKA